MRIGSLGTVNRSSATSGHRSSAASWARSVCFLGRRRTSRIVGVLVLPPVVLPVATVVIIVVAMSILVVVMLLWRWCVAVLSLGGSLRGWTAVMVLLAAVSSIIGRHDGGLRI